MLEIIFSYVQIIISYVILLPWILLMLVITSLIPPEVNTDVHQYETYRHELNYAVDFMPEINTLGEYDELRFGYQKTSGFLFVAETMSLTAKYSEDEYSAVKETMLTHYDFIDAPVVDTNGNVLLDDSFIHNGYVFRAVPTYRHSFQYGACKYFGILGINDDLCCIAWLYYDDADRDYVAEADADLDQEMRDLIDDEFHWDSFIE